MLGVAHTIHQLIERTDFLATELCRLTYNMKKQPFDHKRD